MINFQEITDKEVTESTPAVDIVKIMLLQRLNDLIDSIELYKKHIAQGIQSSSYPLIKARLNSLFLQLQPTLKRKKKKEEYQDIKDKSLDPKSFNEILEVTLKLNEFLDDLKVTRIDFKELYDKTDLLASNKRRGLS